MCCTQQVSEWGGTPHGGWCFILMFYVATVVSRPAEGRGRVGCHSERSVAPEERSDELQVTRTLGRTTERTPLAGRQAVGL